MRNSCRFLLVLSVGIFVCAGGARAQDDDSPSLGDVARKTRQERQLKDAQMKSGQSADSQATTTVTNGQNKDGPVKGATPQSAKDTAKAPKKVITNEQLSDHAATADTTKPASDAKTTASTEATEGNGKVSSDVWKEQILEAKNAISQIEGQIQDLTDSIRYVGSECVSNCQAWNEQQQKKQQQVESMTSQLGELQKHLEEMQDQARKQGYGSSVYDP